jgi:molybdopterin-guanine dinucleotide biosynthesis protein A
MHASDQFQESVTEKLAAYPAPLDAIVLAGTDRNPKRLIANRNKAFLDMGGKVLVRYVIDALLEAKSIGHVYVVGPSQLLSEVLPVQSSRVTVVEQVGKMLTNTWAGINACEASYSTGEEYPMQDRPMLFISCDLPLISARAVDDFVAHCARVDAASGEPFSLLAGVAEEASLKAYYPQDDKPGIFRPYVHFNDSRLRLANIYVARPHSLSHQEFLQTGFSYRKAKDYRNVLSLARSFFGRTGGWHAAWLTLRLQLTLMAYKREGWLYRKMRSGNTVEKIERACGHILGGSVRIIVTPYGGLSLDVDDEEDYRVLNQRFRDWTAPGRE